MSRHPDKSPTHEGRAGNSPFGDGADRAAAPVTEVYDDGSVGWSPHPQTGKNDVESNAAVDRPVPAGVQNTDQAVEGPGQ